MKRSAHQVGKPIGRPWLLMAPALTWLCLFTVLPLCFMIVMSFWSSSMFGTKPDFQFGNYTRIWETTLYSRLLLKTLWLGASCTVIALLISYPIAFFLTRLSGRAKAVFIVMLFLPFWTSYVVRTFAWLPILGRNGAVNEFLLSFGIVAQPVEWLLYSDFAVYVGLIYVYTLYMALPIFLSLDKIDNSFIEAAVDLGARPIHVFWHVLLPLSWPGILSGSIMVFLLGISAFVTPQLLGGPSGVMYGNLIAGQFLNSNNWAFGAALSVVLIAIVVTLLAISARWIGLRAIFTGGRAS